MEAKALIFGEPQGFYNISFSFEVQRRKHQKKRINKKWLKRYGYKPLHVSVDGKIEKAEGSEFIFKGHPIRYGAYCALGAPRANVIL